MKRSDTLEAYRDFSARTSENVRQLSFAALGVIWVFKPEAALQFPVLLVWAGIFSIGTLAADFLQSLYGTVAWGRLHRLKELQGITEDTDFKAPKQINWPTNTLFAAKVVALAATYVLLFCHLARVIQAS